MPSSPILGNCASVSHIESRALPFVVFISHSLLILDVVKIHVLDDMIIETEAHVYVAIMRQSSALNPNLSRMPEVLSIKRKTELRWLPVTPLAPEAACICDARPAQSEVDSNADSLSLGLTYSNPPTPVNRRTVI